VLHQVCLSSGGKPDADGEKVVGIGEALSIARRMIDLQSASNFCTSSIVYIIIGVCLSSRFDNYNDIVNAIGDGCTEAVKGERKGETLSSPSTPKPPKQQA
jgi:hypothetical protein